MSLPEANSVHKSLSFAEFVDGRGLNDRLRKGFLTHVRLQYGDFNYRTESEWRRLYTDFDRGRRP